MNDRPNPRVLPLVLLCTVTLWATAVGCAGCDPNYGDDGGPDASDASQDSGQDASQDSGQDASTNDGGQDASVDGGQDAAVFPNDGGCGPSGAACTAGGAPCCSNNCNSGFCGPQVFCASSGVSCTTNSQCCSGNCNSGTCSTAQCSTAGTTCSNDTECCSGNCAGTCQATPSGSTCIALNDSCTVGGTACCSKNCQAGQCQMATNCISTTDVCYLNSECCTLQCSSNDGVTGGRCLDTPSSPNCGGAGATCTVSNDCCSKVCADPGSGVKVCQAVSGCRVAGDTCTVDTDCCGGLGTPGGTVDCVNGDFACDNGGACRQPGTICGKPVNPDGTCYKLPDGGCFTVSNETNCCGNTKSGGIEYACKVDEVGVPRCFGSSLDGGVCPLGLTGEPGCCISAGDVCQFKDQCCNGAPCVPDDLGISRCTVAQCIGQGSTCTPGGSGSTACCAGTECLANSEVTYACLPPSVADGGGCTVNGNSCTNPIDCCSGICNNGTCTVEQCQPQGAVCTTDGDCCTGSSLKCSIPAGSTSGTCQPGASCGGAGQSCSPTQPCCANLSLICSSDVTGLSCDGTTSCTCGYPVGKAPTPELDYSWQ